jgi:flagellar protein FlaI
MRQRPEYLIVGEVRGSEAYTLFQAMATGHGGLATLHAESVESTIRRLESEPMNIPRSLITTLDAIVVIRRMRVKDRSVRRILSATEITGLDTQTKELLIKQVFVWAPKTDSHTFRRRSHLLDKIVEEHGLSYDDVEDELKNRRDVIEWMCENNLHDFKDVVDVIQSYYADPLSLKERMGR